MPLSNALRKENAAEFYFVEGECEAEPVEGITDFYEGPYLSFYPWPPRMDKDEYNASRERAYELIYEAIEEEGPFHAILGFSQGASLAYLFLQQHTQRHPFEPPWSLFRCAVFICGMPPFRLEESPRSSVRHSLASSEESVDSEELSRRLSPLLSKPSRPTTDSSESSYQSSPPLAATSIHVKEAFFVPESDDYDIIFDEDSEALRIPSVHIGGRNDKVYGLTRRLYSGMKKENSVWLEHELGHTIPWDKKNTQAFVDVIKQLERRAVLS